MGTHFCVVSSNALILVLFFHPNHFILRMGISRIYQSFELLSCCIDPSDIFDFFMFVRVVCMDVCMYVCTYLMLKVRLCDSS